MNKKERAAVVYKKLKQLYPKPPIPLHHKDPFTLLIAVLLSAQCTDERVNQVTPFLFKKADKPQKMIKLSVEEIRSIIRPCGLSPKKSKAIFELSHILLNKHEGRVPQSFEELEKLPGVGHKTASVVMSQAFGFPAFPVDTHIHRLAQRWGLTSGKRKRLAIKVMSKTHIIRSVLWSMERVTCTCRGTITSIRFATAEARHLAHWN